MLFNSFQFLFFLPLTVAVYWSCARNVRLQNAVVIVSSYIFYGWWDWRFLILIAFTSLWSYLTGLAELKRWNRDPSKTLLALSLVVNLGILGVFKYYNFFAGEFVSLLNGLGLKAHMSSLNIILPVGISFYTFQALSYTIDVYRRQLKPTEDVLAFFAFISFFPQLVAGPIERATNLLPQFVRRKTFCYPEAVAGCRQMLWGFFKKMVVADNCAVVVNRMLDGSQADGLAIILGVFMFSFQIYGDFSGYSDIAIGCARLFGINLMRNFNFPYFSRDIAEFWRRWHISLTTWFRDYLYIPLGGSRCGRRLQIRNTFAIFLVSGVWHGANWTFILWGAFHAMLFLPLLLNCRNRRYVDTVASGRIWPGMTEMARMLGTFLLAAIGWGIFRASSVGEFFRWVVLTADISTWHWPQCGMKVFPVALGAIVFLSVAEWFNRNESFGFARYPRNAFLRHVLYILLTCIILLYTPGAQEFIYFQF